MKITDVRAYVLPAGWKEWVIVLVGTDEGLLGVGEATLEYRAASVVAALAEAAEYLVGMDPAQIEVHWQALYRGYFWRTGPVQMTALSAIDQALWDLAGQTAGLPVYRLFGGPCRDTVRVYVNQWYRGAKTDEELAEAARATVAQGFTALKWYPFRFMENAGFLYDLPAAQLRRVVSQIATIREAVGPDVDLMVDLTAKANGKTAETFCREVEGLKLFWVEEPVPPENVEVLAKLARAVKTPIATGERLFTRWEFRTILEKQAASFIQPDVCHAGGLTEMRKIAAMAEAYFIGVAPHNPNGPVSTAASVQFAASTPNFVILESYGNGVPPVRDEIMAEGLRIQDGVIRIPTTAGFGVRIDENALRRLAVPALGHWRTRAPM